MKASSWRPISTAPRDRLILLYVPRQTGWGQPWIGVGHFEIAPEGPSFDGYWKAENPLVSATAATHWLPIPAPPEADAPTYEAAHRERGLHS
jgi:hypothetical protein